MGGTSSKVVYFSEVTKAKTATDITLPEPGSKPDTSTVDIKVGSVGWDKLAKPTKDKVEGGGYYSKSISDTQRCTDNVNIILCPAFTNFLSVTACELNRNLAGGNQTVRWVIEEKSRTKQVNAVVGHAALVGSSNPAKPPPPKIVPVWSADGKDWKEAGGKRLYHFQNDYEG